MLVGSASDPGEAYEPGTLVARAARRRAHARQRRRHVGGAATARRGSPRAAATGAWNATPLPGPKVDDYGCGDAFAAALTYGLGAGMMLDEAIELAARCGAAVLCGRGPYGAMLGAGDL